MPAFRRNAALFCSSASRSPSRLAYPLHLSACGGGTRLLYIQSHAGQDAWQQGRTARWRSAAEFHSGVTVSSDRSRFSPPGLAGRCGHSGAQPQLALPGQPALRPRKKTRPVPFSRSNTTANASAGSGGGWHRAQSAACERSRQRRDAAAVGTFNSSPAAAVALLGGPGCARAGELPSPKAAATSSSIAASPSASSQGSMPPACLRGHAESAATVGKPGRFLFLGQGVGDGGRGAAE